MRISAKTDHEHLAHCFALSDLRFIYFLLGFVVITLLIEINYVSLNRRICIAFAMLMNSS